MAVWEKRAREEVVTATGVAEGFSLTRLLRRLLLRQGLRWVQPLQRPTRLRRPVTRMREEVAEEEDLEEGAGLSDGPSR